MKKFLLVVLAVVVLSMTGECASAQRNLAAMPALRVSENRHFLMTDDGKPFTPPTPGELLDWVLVLESRP